jgi:Xaa-Pro aminopeptidase
LENLYLLAEHHKDEAGRQWLCCEPITWVPFDPDLIEDSLLEPAEIEWLDQYHRTCIEKLSPLLPETERYELRALVR